MQPFDHVCQMPRARLDFSALAFALPWPARAQFTDPRNYENVPVGLNQLEMTYAYSQANTSIDPAIVIVGAKLNLSQTIIGYTRYFSLFHRMAWVEPSVRSPYSTVRFPAPMSADLLLARVTRTMKWPCCQGVRALSGGLRNISQQQPWARVLP